MELGKYVTFSQGVYGKKMHIGHSMELLVPRCKTYLSSHTKLEASLLWPANVMPWCNTHSKKYSRLVYCGMKFVVS